MPLTVRLPPPDSATASTPIPSGPRPSKVAANSVILTPATGRVPAPSRSATVPLTIGSCSVPSSARRPVIEPSVRATAGSSSGRNARSGTSTSRVPRSSCSPSGTADSSPPTTTAAGVIKSSRMVPYCRLTAAAIRAWSGCRITDAWLGSNRSRGRRSASTRSSSASGGSARLPGEVVTCNSPVTTPSGASANSSVAPTAPTSCRSSGPSVAK